VWACCGPDKIESGEFEGKITGEQQGEEPVPRFGSFVLDSDRRQLVKDDSEIHLTPKAFALLSLLVDAAPRVVPKRELHERLWPNGIVSDATLIGLVKEIRRALDDRDGDAPMIRTVHRVGYAFDAPVERDVRIERAAARPAMSCWLVAADRRIALVEGENIVGRDPQATVHLDYATVSRRHARLSVGPTGATLEDLGSKNGTMYEGKPLTEPKPLRNGDRFSCGQILLTYHESRTGHPTVTQMSRAESVPRNS
jgi:DNA-binding winged helix-turn-helix (wHTH) protein